MTKNFDFKTREPKTEEFDEIYKMGFDVWADGESLESYLDGCRTSPKYRNGEWFVLEKNGSLLSSLLLHSFENNIYGVGSIATATNQRKNGYASVLIENVLRNLQTNRNSKITYLYSDINPEFYERFGFKILPQSLQKYKTTTCMVRFTDSEIDFGKLNPPTYF